MRRQHLNIFISKSPTIRREERCRRMELTSFSHSTLRTSTTPEILVNIPGSERSGGSPLRNTGWGTLTSITSDIRSTFVDIFQSTSTPDLRSDFLEASPREVLCRITGIRFSDTTIVFVGGSGQSLKART